MTKTQLLALLSDKGACDEATAWVKASKKRTAAAIWNECQNPSWMFWIAARVGVDRKLIVLAACACARQALRYAPAGEDRPRVCIETTERWTRGEATIEDVLAARRAASAAAAAAYAAAYAYAYAYAAYAAADAADADAADAAAANAAAADAAAANAAARKRSLARSADLIRKTIHAARVVAAAKGGAK